MKRQRKKERTKKKRKAKEWKGKKQKRKKEKKRKESLGRRSVRNAEVAVSPLLPRLKDSGTPTKTSILGKGLQRTE